MMLINLLIYSLTSWVALITAQSHQSRKLNDGNKIPAIGFGTFGKFSDIKNVGTAVVTAVEAGYRLIDTAYNYMNEDVIGDAIINVTSRGIVKRKELFISTKLSQFDRREAVVPALKTSLARLKLDYGDLYLVHKANQVNPTQANMGLVAYCHSENIQVMSYAPFGFAVPRPFNNKTLPPSFDDPTIIEIANKYGKTPSQVFLRYLIDRVTIPLPKSTTQEHIRSNIDVFDFDLTREEVYKINSFDINTGVYLQQNGFFPDELFDYKFGQL